VVTNRKIYILEPYFRNSDIMVEQLVVLERKVKKSFQLAREDITSLGNSISKLYEQIEKLSAEQQTLADQLKAVKDMKQQKAQKTTYFLGSKETKKFHMPECVFAKNIKKGSKILFPTKNKAISKGYAPCVCLKR